MSSTRAPLERSFTGLRIAAGVVQGLAYGADLPVIPVSTLEAMVLEAYRKYQKDYWLSALDARMGEVYVGGYHVSEIDKVVTIEALLTERVIKPESIDTFNELYNGVGSGWIYKDILLTKVPNNLALVDENIAPRAAYIGELAHTFFKESKAVSVYEAMPSYLRDEISWEKQPLKVGKR